jgi:hypothetical protein
MKMTLKETRNKVRLEKKKPTIAGVILELPFLKALMVPKWPMRLSHHVAQT